MNVLKLVPKVAFYAIVLILFLVIAMVIGLAQVIVGHDFLVDYNAPDWVNEPLPHRDETSAAPAPTDQRAGRMQEEAHA